MTKALLLLASMGLMTGVASFAQTPSAEDLTNVKISYSIHVPDHYETFYRAPIAKRAEGKLYGTEYAVRNSKSPQGDAKISATGKLLDLPQFSWLKDSKYANEIAASSRTGGARLKMDHNMLIRENNFNASNGKTSGVFHEAYRVNVVTKGTQIYNMSIPMASVDVIRQSLESDIETASNTVLRPLVQEACKGACDLEFSGAQSAGLDSNNMAVTVYPDETKPGQVFTIHWPEYTLTAVFKLKALDAKALQAMATESKGN